MAVTYPPVETDPQFTATGATDAEVTTAVGTEATARATADALKVAKTDLGIFNVKDPAYGAVGDGTTDDRSAIDAARQAAESSTASINVVYFPPGTYYLGSGGGIAPSPNLTSTIIFRGAGRDMTTVKLSASCPSFIATPTYATGDALGNYKIEDLYVDDNSVVSTAIGAVVNLVITDAHINPISISRVGAKNLGNLVNGNAGARCVNIQVLTSARFGSTQYTVKKIDVTDCEFGFTGGGGNTGVYIAAAVVGGATNPNLFWNRGGSADGISEANVEFQELVCERVRWTSGSVATVSGGASAAIQFGSRGRILSARIRDCYGEGSGDVTFEIDSCRDALIENCVSVNPEGEHIFIPTWGAEPKGEAAVIRVKDCTAIRSVGTAGSTGFATYAKMGRTVPHLHIENFTFIHDCAGFVIGSTQSEPGPAINLQGPFRSATIKGCRSIWRGIALAPSSSFSPSIDGIRIQAHAGEGALVVEDFEHSVRGSFDAATATCAPTARVLRIDGAAKYSVVTNNVRSDYDVTTANGATFTASDVSAPTTVTGLSNAQELIRKGDISDEFGGSTSLGTDYYFDAGAATNFTQASSRITASANLTTENRAKWISPDLVARRFDSAPYLTAVPGSTLSGFKVGLLHRISDDGATRLECYLKDDGTSSKLYIDKVVSGSSTNLATSSALGTRISNGTAFGLKARLRGDTVTLDYFTSSTAPTDPSASGATTLSYTLSSSESGYFGTSGDPAFVGFVFTPQHASAYLDRIKVLAMSYLPKLELRNWVVKQSKGITTNNGINLSGLTVARHRIGKALIRGGDYAARARVGGLDITPPTETELKSAFTVENFRFGNAVDSAVTAMISDPSAEVTARAAADTAILGAYRNLLRSGGRATTAASGSTSYIALPGISDSGVTGPNANAANASNAFFRRLLAADYAVTGYTTKLRIVAVVATSTGTTPSVTITFGLYPLTVNGSGLLVPGTVVTGSTFSVGSLTTAGALTPAAGSDFTFPSDDIYVIGYTLSGSPSANFTFQAGLELHHV